MDNKKQCFIFTPEAWLQSKYNFKVPVYQRLFTWDTPQFNRLLSDLQEWNKKNEEEPYYLGIITVVKQGNSYILIDGQQRLTVIAILIGMFKEQLKEQFQNLLEKEIINYLDYEARPSDRKALETIWVKGSEWHNKNEDEVNIIMDKNQIVSDSMRSFIKHICKKKDEREWDSIIKNNLFNRLTLLVSILPDSYVDRLELQNEYFEKMNSAGKQLEPHEILKVRICSYSNEIDKKRKAFENWNLIEDFTKKFHNVNLGSSETGFNSKWPSIKEIINRNGCFKNLSEDIKEKIKKPTAMQRTSIEKWRPALIDFPMFLLHVLKIFLDRQGIDFALPQDSHTLLKIFEKKINEDPEKKLFVDFVELMCAYRTFLDEWIIHKDVDSCEQHDEDDKNNTDVSKYSYWDRSEKSMEKKYILSNEDEDNVSKELKQIQMALSAVGEQKQAWMIDAFNFYNYFSHSAPQDDDFRLHLRNYLVRHLTDEAGFKDILSKKVLSHECLTYGDATHAQFVCLDFFLWLLANSKDSKEEKDKNLCNDIFREIDWGAITSFVPKANRSVEHFHPQTDTEGNKNVEAWNRTILGSGTKQTYKDMFGNLALISAGQNSKYGNSTVGGKSDRINYLIANKGLESIKIYLMMKECNEKDDEWTPCCACKHAQKMLAVLKWGNNLLGDRYKDPYVDEYRKIKQQ